MRTAIAVFVFIAGAAILWGWTAIARSARKRDQRELQRSAQTWGKR